ncbi:MAG: hypothetical protein LBR19_01640 [Bifidobacteriaceae bacterium]|jgi:hypothetical protein|nr:hypothetical protein [Bifidobacteriaceae bacterium]
MSVPPDGQEPALPPATGPTPAVPTGEVPEVQEPQAAQTAPEPQAAVEVPAAPVPDVAPVADVAPQPVEAPATAEAPAAPQGAAPEPLTPPALPVPPVPLGEAVGQGPATPPGVPQYSPYTPAAGQYAQAQPPAGAYPQMDPAAGPQYQQYQQPGAGYAAPDGQYATYTGQPLPQPAKKSKKRLVLVAGGTAVVLALAGGGYFAVKALTGAQGGAATPEESASQFLQAVASLDFTEAVTHIAPSERNLISDWFTLWGKDAEDVEPDEALQDAWDDIKDAVTIELTDLEFTSDEVAEGISRTVLDHGTIKLDADSDKLAAAMIDLVDVLDDTLDSLPQVSEQMDFEAISNMDEDDLADELDSFFPVSKDIEDLVDMSDLDELFFMNVEEDGKWYASVSMTVAEYAFEAYGYDTGDLSDPIPDSERPKFDSPEAAAAGLVEAWNSMADSGDIRELAAVLPDAESRLLAVYGPALIDEDDLAEIASLVFLDGFAGSVAKQEGSSAVVLIDNLDVDLDIDGGVSFNLSHAGTTTSVAGDYGDSSLTVTLDFPDDYTWDLAMSFDEAFSVFDLTASLKVTDTGVLEGELNFANEGSDGTTTGSASAQYADGCISYEAESDGDSISGEVCGSDIGLNDSAQQDLDATDKLTDPAEAFSLRAFQGANGSWYISPSTSNLTLVGTVTALFAVIANMGYMY